MRWMDKRPWLGPAACVGWIACYVAAFAVIGCTQPAAHVDSASPGHADRSATKSTQSRIASTSKASRQAIGFDRNDYPGDATMAAMRNTFAFTGYWLTSPPGESANSWAGKRAILRQQGWGFLVLANGRLDAEILKAQRSKIAAADLGRRDAAIAIAIAQHEGFPAQTILFLDQEEGGRLLDEQAAYLLAWTETIAASDYRPGVYASGQPVDDTPPNVKPAKTITTIEDIRSRVTAGHLHPIAIFDAQDACPPAPGCTVHAKPLSASGEPVFNRGGDLIAWQYSQSPRRPDTTASCADTYAPDGNCYPPGSSTLFIDMDAASSADPSHGR